MEIMAKTSNATPAEAREVTPAEAARLFGQWVAKLHVDQHVNKLVPAGYGPLRKARLIKLLSERFPKVPPSEFRRMTALDLLPYLEEAAAGGPTLPRRRKRRRRATAGKRKSRSLTSRQTEVVQIVGECKGNLAEAARRLGRDRKTVEETYRVALAKLGKEPVKHGERLLFRDRRGQADASDIDDERRDSVDETHRRKFRRS
jgi:hypothetical protein